MSGQHTFEPTRYPSTEEGTDNFPFYRYFETAAPPVLGIESEMTSGFRIEPGRNYGFFTDTTLCISCKAACRL